MLQHINNPVALPRALSHMACRNITELVNIRKMAIVNAEDIGGVAFVFLECNITEYTYHVKGMQMHFLFDLSFRSQPILWFS
jgi:hypothetical protein